MNIWRGVGVQTVSSSIAAAPLLSALGGQLKTFVTSLQQSLNKCQRGICFWKFIGERLSERFRHPVKEGLLRLRFVTLREVEKYICARFEKGGIVKKHLLTDSGKVVFAIETFPRYPQRLLFFFALEHKRKMKELRLNMHACVS
jgi:hypothetical protein